MKLTSPARVQELLDSLDFRPSKVLGQNFLIDENVRRILVAEADVLAKDVVLEIGPGLGVLTEAMLEKGARVVAVEKDFRLCAYLRERFADEDRLELIEGDALELGPDRLAGQGVTKVVSNLPYAVGTRILVELVTGRARPGLILVTVQLDVAHRLAAAPNSGQYGVLSILAQLDYDVALRRKISPSCFLPKPGVWSGIVALVRRRRPRVEVRAPEFFRDLVKWAFTHRRKQLGALLRDAPAPFRRTAAQVQAIFQSLEIDPRARPEALSVESWGRLANALR